MSQWKTMEALVVSERSVFFFFFFWGGFILDFSFNLLTDQNK